MAIYNSLKVLLDRREKTRYWLWQQTGLAQNTAYRAVDDSRYVPGEDAMNKICTALECQPGEWLTWVPDD